MKLSFVKMTEMHLDLCIQSTTHLLETVSNLKENIRILEVFLNSGLQIVDFNGGIGNGEFSSEERGYSSLDSKFYQYLNSRSSGANRHVNCCCMCRFRGSKPDERPTSRTSVTTVSNSSYTNSSKQKAQITPRLNKTASLRRARVLQRIAASSGRNGK